MKLQCLTPQCSAEWLQMVSLGFGSESKASPQAVVETGGAFLCLQASCREKTADPAQPSSPSYTIACHSILAGLSLSGNALDSFLCSSWLGRWTSAGAVSALHPSPRSAAGPVLHLCATTGRALGFQPHKLIPGFQQSCRAKFLLAAALDLICQNEECLRSQRAPELPLAPQE